MITPRDYQFEQITEIKFEYKKGNKIVLAVLSTGGGKSIILGYIVLESDRKNKVVYVIAHKAELIEQLSLTMCKFGIQHRIVAQQNKVINIKHSQYKAFNKVFWQPNSNIIIASVQTLVNRFNDLPKPDFIITDEGHHVSEGNQWGEVYDRYPDAYGLLLSATPKRTDGRGLGRGHGGYADAMVVGKDMGWLIDNGHLSPYKIYTVSNQWDLKGARSGKDGDFTSQSLDKVIDKPSITGDAIQHYKKLALGIKAICFSVSIEASKYMADQLNANGIPAIHVDGKLLDSDRRDAIRKYAEDRYMVLCCESLVDEGFDLESISQIDGATIDCLIDLSPTQSIIKYMQRVGRVLRPKKGKIAILIDHAGNCLRHGLPDMEREWSLEGEVKSSRNSDEKAISVRTCPKCYRIHLPEPVCPECGFIYPLQQRVVEEKEGELVELTKEDKERMKYELKWSKKREQSSAESLEDLIALGQKRGYKNPKGWALRLHHAREQKNLGA